MVDLSADLNLPTLANICQGYTYHLDLILVLLGAGELRRHLQKDAEKHTSSGSVAVRINLETPSQTISREWLAVDEFLVGMGFKEAR